MIKQYLAKIEAQLDVIFAKKAPAIPENIKELIVKYSPYLSILALLLSLPAILLALGVTTLALPFAVFGAYRHVFSFSTILSIAVIILEIAAIPGLFKRQKSAWDYLFYASLINLFSSLISFDLGSLIIGGLISFWILFQVRSYYKN